MTQHLKSTLILTLLTLFILTALTGPKLCAAFVTPPGQTNTIIFQSSRDGNYDIYIMDSDGTNPTRLIDTPRWIEEFPSWSPDGSKILFARSDNGIDTWNICVTDADGTNPVRLTSSNLRARGPRWSPDGTKIAFEAIKDLSVVEADVYVMNADGSGLTKLPITCCWGDPVTWSPDSKKIASIVNYGAIPSDIQIVSLDTLQATRFANQAHALYLSWSPDGTKFAVCAHGSEIGTIHTDGTGYTKLLSEGYGPEWSPDGSQIVYTNGTGIMKINADGSNLTVLTHIDGEYSDCNATFKP